MTNKPSALRSLYTAPFHTSDRSSAWVRIAIDFRLLVPTMLTCGADLLTRGFLRPTRWSGFLRISGKTNDPEWGGVVQDSRNRGSGNG